MLLVSAKRATLPGCLPLARKEAALLGISLTWDSAGKIASPCKEYHPAICNDAAFAGLAASGGAVWFTLGAW